MDILDEFVFIKNQGGILKKIILAGGGHGHINILKNLIRNPIENFEIKLITDNEKQYYSGMLAAFMEGIYSEDEISFDVKNLCQKAGVKYIEEKILSIDKENNVIKTENNTYNYDFLSINLGSLMNINFPIDSENVILVKPIANIVKSKEILNENYKNKENLNIFLVGGGASGIELGLALKTSYKKASVNIVTKGEILKNFNTKAKKKFEKILTEKNINIYKNEEVLKIRDKQIFTNKTTHEFDFCFVSSGFRGQDIDFKGFDLFEKNYIKVDERLFAGENILAMGDVCTINKYPQMPKAGVFAIREAPILYENLKKMINNESDFITYKPQEKYLQIINCGDKYALSNYGKFASFGKISWLIKDKIDRDYMKI